MYKPKFNSVLVAIDDKDAQWGGENNENMLGKSYSKGKLVSFGIFLPTKEYPIWEMKEMLDKPLAIDMKDMTGKSILWNEGAEAGTTFEEDSKLYGFIYWWDIRGVKE